MPTARAACIHGDHRMFARILLAFALLPLAGAAQAQLIGGPE